MKPPHVRIDALGLLCPLPVLKLRKKLQVMSDGDSVILLTDDPAAIIDVPHFCHESGNSLVKVTIGKNKVQKKDTREFLIKKL